MAPPSALLRAVRGTRANGYRGGMLASTALLVALAMQNAPAPAPAPAAPPAPRPKLLERSTLRPSRAGEARQNYAQEVDPAPSAPAPAEPVPAAAAAPAVGTGEPSAEPTATAAPANASPVRMAPSAVAPGSAQGSTQAAAPAAGGRKPFPIDRLVPVAALAMLVGPAIGAIWFLGRSGGQPTD